MLAWGRAARERAREREGVDEINDDTVTDTVLYTSLDLARQNAVVVLSILAQTHTK